MTLALSSALSGMLANQNALDISSHNTANSTTNGFRPARPAFVEQAGGGVTTAANPASRVSLSTAGSAAASQDRYLPSGTDLGTEAVNSLTYLNAFEASARMVKVQDQMLGSLLDVKA